MVQGRVRLIGFRFIFSYLVLYTFAFPFYYIPYSWYVLEPVNYLYTYLTDWMGALLFGESYNVFNPDTGSGDTSYKYAQAVVFLMLALIATVVWSVIDRDRPGYRKLPVILTTLVRYYLAATLISYGVVKIFPLQFPVPQGMMLSRTYGESSPMGLLWTFMGASRLYSAFTGTGELVAGILLLFRSTRLIGAVLSTFVFIHVFVLNLAYDVPVKLFSFHLLLLSVFLAAPLAGNTIKLVGTDEPPLAETMFPRWYPEKVRWFLIAVKGILILLILVQPAYDAFLRDQELRAAAASSSQPEIYGIYTISRFTRNNEPVQDGGLPRWKELKLAASGIEVVYGDGATVQWLSSIRSKKLRMASKDLGTYGEFDLVMEGDKLSLTGKLNEDSLRIEARQTGRYQAPLLDRGFHWVNEEPYNR